MSKYKIRKRLNVQRQSSSELHCNVVLDSLRVLFAVQMVTKYLRKYFSQRCFCIKMSSRPQSAICENCTNAKYSDITKLNYRKTFNERNFHVLFILLNTCISMICGLELCSLNICSNSIQFTVYQKPIYGWTYYFLSSHLRTGSFCGCLGWNITTDNVDSIYINRNVRMEFLSSAIAKSIQINIFIE